MDRKSRIYVAGHRGLVGSAIMRRLDRDGYTNLITRTRQEVDLTNQKAVYEFFKEERPEYVFLAAAKVGGILANSTYPAEFIRENLVIQNNVIDAAYRYGTRKLLFLGSSCIYPKHAQQPMKDEYLLTGPLEPTNEAYAVAKIAGIKMCQAYYTQYGFNAITVIPSNLYGPGDKFNLQSSHVLPALIRKCHEAKVSGAAEVVVWGSGEPRREFLYVDDLADALIFLMLKYNSKDIMHVGAGQDISIHELAELVKNVIGFQGEIVYDSSRPDGIPRKLLDVSRLEGMGWKASTSLHDGILQTYEWYRGNST